MSPVACSNVDVLVRGHNEEKDKNTGFIDVPYSHCDDKFKGKEERTFMIKPFDKNYVDQMTVTLTNVEHSRNPRVLTISKLYLAQKRPAPGTTSRSVPRVCESASVFKPTNTLPGPPHKRGTETVPHRQYIPSNDQTHLPDSELRRAMAASMESYKRESQRKPGHGPSDGKEEVEVEEEKVMIKNEVPPPKKSAPQPLTKVFTNIGEDGWCTPWAEELDLVNIFFIGIREGTRQREAEEYARRLGAGVTENSALATHVLTDPDFEPEILKDSVKDGQRVVNVDWLIQCWKLKKYVPEQ